MLSANLILQETSMFIAISPINYHNAAPCDLISGSV